MTAKTDDPQTIEDTGVKEKKKGPPFIPDEDKFTARYVIQMTDAQKDEVKTYVTKRKMKIAFFYRTAAEEYMKNHPLQSTNS